MHDDVEAGFVKRPTHLCPNSLGAACQYYLVFMCSVCRCAARMAAPIAGPLWWRAISRVSTDSAVSICSARAPVVQHRLIMGRAVAHN